MTQNCDVLILAFSVCYQRVTCMDKIFYKLVIIYVIESTCVEFPFCKCLFFCYSAHWQHRQWCLFGMIPRCGSKCHASQTRRGIAFKENGQVSVGSSMSATWPLHLTGHSNVTRRRDPFSFHWLSSNIFKHLQYKKLW
jgi:hypothetical protein